MIEIDHVQKRFGGNIVLQDVSFQVAAGEVVCLLGPSGSGKSTLLRCINGLERHDGGRICVGGIEVTPASLPEVRRKVAMVFQKPTLFPHRTVLENITEGPVYVLGREPARARAEALELLAKVGLLEKAGEYPHRLSGGQQQRVGIVRALAMRASAVLFDEPTSALDPERVAEVLLAMRQLAADGHTMMVVTHEVAFARDVADRVVFMDGGRVVECGPARQTLDSPGSDRLRAFLARGPGSGANR